MMSNSPMSNAPHMVEQPEGEVLNRGLDFYEEMHQGNFMPFLALLH